DIAVRMVAPQQEQLIARRLGRIELGLHATAAYLTRQGLPTTLDDLASHALKTGVSLQGPANERGGAIETN
ncbi:hypothetical protein OQ620_27605, partial [Klebsiella pneumoniae]|nr:hypothetical protein [Klebsiella pneumoniae]